MPLFINAPSPIRTGNRRFRRPLLYPIEPWAQIFIYTVGQEPKKTILQTLCFRRKITLYIKILMFLHKKVNKRLIWPHMCRADFSISMKLCFLFVFIFFLLFLSNPPIVQTVFEYNVQIFSNVS